MIFYVTDTIDNRIYGVIARLGHVVYVADALAPESQPLVAVRRTDLLENKRWAEVAVTSEPH